jgi:hypothetical protein
MRGLEHNSNGDQARVALQRSAQALGSFDSRLDLRAQEDTRSASGLQVQKLVCANASYLLIVDRLVCATESELRPQT